MYFINIQWLFLKKNISLIFVCVYILVVMWLSFVYCECKWIIWFYKVIYVYVKCGYCVFKKKINVYYRNKYLLSIYNENFVFVIDFFVIVFDQILVFFFDYGSVAMSSEGMMQIILSFVVSVNKLLYGGMLLDNFKSWC